MWRLVPALVEQMGGHFPELKRAQPLIEETLKLEENSFKDMLVRGLRLLEEETSKLPEAAPLPGEVAFRLYDTFGFPLDLTQDILRGQGRTVDVAGYEEAMERQRAAARAAWAGSGEEATEKLWFQLHERIGATEFLGYETESAEGIVQAIICDGEEVESAEAGAEIAFITNQTPFYAESGGQQGDSGRVFASEKLEIAVSDTQKKPGDLHVHYGKILSGVLTVGQAVELRVDGERRAALRAHHSATHLLHEALRRRLGDHVTQKGSLVAPDRLRFDFSHPRPLTREDLHAIEAMVNERIRANAEVETRFMTPEEAMAAGALALFGEKYGEEVRVVSMGGEDAEKGEGRSFSTELCGGTHVRRVGDIGFFKIISEQALAAGVRRIEAVVGKAALEWVEQQEALLEEAAGALRTPPEELPKRIVSLLEERRRLERELSEARRKLATGGGGGTSAPLAREVAGLKLATRVVEGLPPRDLKPMVDELKKQLGSGIAAVVAVNDGKASLVVGVTDDLTKRFSAVDLVRLGAEALGGKGGGGRPDMAQAGGPAGDQAEAALKAIEAALLETAAA